MRLQNHHRSLSRTAWGSQQLRHTQRGMNLIEIMVVLVIISLVSGIVGVNVFNSFRTAQMQAAQTQIRQIQDALDQYRLQKRRYPSTADGLAALTQGTPTSPAVMDKIPKDPWDSDYVYISPGVKNPSGVDIMSYGPDRAEGGGDDIGNWAAQQ